MPNLLTPHAISDFTYKLLHNSTGSCRLQLQPHLTSLTVTAYPTNASPIVATIMCPQFIAQLLPSLRNAYFRAQIHGQRLMCDAYWLRYQVHACLLAEEVDYYLAKDLDLLDEDAARHRSHKSQQWNVMLTINQGQVHVYSSGGANPTFYAPAPIVSRRWAPAALSTLQYLLQQEGKASTIITYSVDLFTPIRLRRKLQLLLPS